MEQQKSNSDSKKGKHLKREERIQMEGLLKAKVSTAEIARQLGRTQRTIQRERKQGLVKHLNSDLSESTVYNADRSQDIHDLNATAKGALMKLKANSDAQEFIRYHLVEKRFSPEVIAALMKKENIDDPVCAKTIYTYIELNYIPGVTNETLWEKRKRGKKHKSVHRQPKRAPTPGKGIDDRPAAVDDREEAGHWEIDLVVGGKGKGKAVLLTLCERTSRMLIIRKLSDRTQHSVIRAINSIERAMGREEFSEKFRTITSDNGSEFLDYNSIEKSVYSKRSRTKQYFAHAYASWERGSNENINRMIRRFIPKGSDITKKTHAQIRSIEEWINRYPRKILNFQTAEEVFMKVLEA